jgi:hypothetical protein
MTNVLKMLEERRKRGSKLNLYKEVMPNRERANVMHNRAVRAKLVTAREAKRRANHLVRVTSEARETVLARFLATPDSYDQATIQRANGIVIQAQERRAGARHRYDKLVEEANDVMRKHEVYKKHYRSNVRYREGNAAHVVAAFNA